jgi:hypothetical protein
MSPLSERGFARRFAQTVGAAGVVVVMVRDDDVLELHAPRAAVERVEGLGARLEGVVVTEAAVDERRLVAVAN